MNNFHEVLIALNTLAEEPSTNAKVVLLKEFCKSELFKKVCFVALTGRFNYHMTKLPEVPINTVFADQGAVFKSLEQLSDSTGASNVDKNSLAFLAAANRSSYEIVSRIIKKDLKCGVSAKTINKAYPKLIKEWPYMRCQSFTEKNLKRIKYPAQVEEKCDGTHVDVVVKGGKISYWSRKGRPMEFHGMLDEFFDHIVGDFVFIGEGLVVDKFGVVVPRKEGNGIINKAIKGTITREEAERVDLTLWDVVPYTDFVNGYCKFTQKQRFEKLKLEFPENFDEVVKVVDLKVVHNEQQAMKFYNEIRKEGGEGAIVKNFNGVFKNHTSPDQVKVKAEYEAEFEVVDYKPGEPGSKYAEVLGAILVESVNGEVSSWVGIGSGFTDQNRTDLFCDEILGEIVTIKFESLITRRKRESLSLFLPRFIEIRKDKWEPDTLEYLLELTS